MNLNTDSELIFTTDDTWSLFVGGTDILANAKWLRGYPDGRQVWQSLTPLFGGWLRVRAMAKPGSATVKWWAWWVAGDTSLAEPRLYQPEIRITSSPELKPLVDFTICQKSDLVPDPENEGYTLGGLLQGQGCTLRSFFTDHAGLTWGGDGAKQEPNHYMPRSPNKTGGKWPYMGLTFDTDKIAVTDMYAAGCYGGYFQHANTGELVAETDFPDLQASSHIHEHSKDKGWINYTDPRNTWRDRMSIMRTNPDGQHYCQTSVLAQMVDAHPEDEGLKMLLEALSHVYTRQFPAEARGTTHHTSGQERSERVLKGGVDAFLALRTDDEASALRFGRRAMERWSIYAKAFTKRFQEHGVGFARFGRTGAYSTGEIGIHYWAMWRLHEALEELDLPDIGAVNFWMDEARRWCFESWRFYDVQGDRHWGYPYFEDKDHNDLSGPVSSEHFAWLAAVHYQPQNPAEEEKHAAILELGNNFAPRFVR